MSIDGKRLFAKVVLVVSMVVTQGCSSLHPPVTVDHVDAFAARLGDSIDRGQEPLIGVLSVEEAVARAIRNNYSVRAKELEAALADAKVRVQAGAMLPSIVAESDYYRRDRLLASHSNLSPTYSSSSDLQSVSRNIAISWNLLDFGLSYVRSRQGLDKAYQQHEETRRVAARIAEETRGVFWRAVALQKLEPSLARIDQEVADALSLARVQARDPLIDPMLAINFQRDLLNAQRELNQVHSSIAGATEQLKQSTGLGAMERLRLAGERRLDEIARPSGAADGDVAIALRQRPEIRQHMYDLRITEEEVNATIVQLLPGITLNTTFATDSNAFLLHHNWLSWGAKMAANLVNLARLPNDLALIDAQAETHRANALATAATIAMQVHVARARLDIQLRAYRDAERFEEAQRQLFAQARAAVRSGKAGQQQLTRERLALLLSEVRAIVAFADLHAAYGAYVSSKGETPSAPRTQEQRSLLLSSNFIVD